MKDKTKKKIRQRITTLSVTNSRLSPKREGNKKKIQSLSHFDCKMTYEIFMPKIFDVSYSWR